VPTTSPRPEPLAEGEGPIGEPYQTLEQQHETAEFGMWIFLATELMLFGGLFTAYTVYRSVYPEGFAEGSRHLDLVYGAVNTVILLISSLTMVLAVQAAEVGHRRKLFWYLVATAALGVLFLVIKGAEYEKHFTEGMVPGLNWTYAGPNANAVQLLFIAYFTMTGLHSIHLIIAIVIVAIFAFRLPERRTSVEMVGLYWHFVDIIWTFLFPLLYLFGLGT
jgi:cytochrome c oxidase subunit III